MKNYIVTFYFDNKILNWDNPVDEEDKKIIVKAFMKSDRFDAGNTLIDLSKCLFVTFKEVEV